MKQGDIYLFPFFALSLFPWAIKMSPAAVQYKIKSQRWCANDTTRLGGFFIPLLPPCKMGLERVAPGGPIWGWWSGGVTSHQFYVFVLTGMLKMKQPLIHTFILLFILCSFTFRVLESRDCSKDNRSELSSITAQ